MFHHRHLLDLLVLFWGIPLFLSPHPSYFFGSDFKKKEKGISRGKSQKRQCFARRSSLPTLRLTLRRRAIALPCEPVLRGAARCHRRCCEHSSAPAEQWGNEGWGAGGPSLCTITSAPRLIRRGAAPPRCPGLSAAPTARPPLGGRA